MIGLEYVTHRKSCRKLPIERIRAEDEQRLITDQ